LIDSEDDVLGRLLRLGDEYRPLLSRIEIRFLSVAGLAILAEHFAFPPECVFCSILGSLIHPLRWNSAIVPGFPTLFEDFKQKQLTLLWRGSRDGFRATDFHSRCDGHANTLTMILDTDGNIFGGFTRARWESGFRTKYNPGRSLKSYIFTVKNPHNVPARSFALKAQRKDEAILCNSHLQFWREVHQRHRTGRKNVFHGSGDIQSVVSLGAGRTNAATRLRIYAVAKELSQH
jgi:hypothetical protein